MQHCSEHHRYLINECKFNFKILIDSDTKYVFLEASPYLLKNRFS